MLVGRPRGSGYAVRQGAGTVALVAAVLGASFLIGTASNAVAQSLVLERRIELPSVRGRIDHMAIDLEGQRLFVAVLASDSVEVVDLREGRRVDRITSLHEPQGVLYLSRHRRLLVANGAGGGVQAFTDGRSPVTASQPSLDDADNLRLDPINGNAYVGAGDALVALDPDTLQILRRFTLAGHPESFQIDPSGRRIYVNVPTPGHGSPGHVAVVDRDSGKVEATWPVRDATRNFPMALDEGAHHLFIATRSPALLLVYDTGSGKETARVPVCGDADDLFVDDVRGGLLVICGDGHVDVMRREGEKFERAERVETAPGARTGLFVPTLSMLLVAAPARGGSMAEIRAYSVR